MRMAQAVFVLLTTRACVAAAEISQVGIDVRNKSVVIDLVISDVVIPTRMFDPALFNVTDAASGKALRIVQAEGVEPTTISLTLAEDQSIAYGQSLLISIKPLPLANGPVKITPKV